MANTTLILHVKGTEQTTSLPRQIVRAGIARGQITYSQLIWSPLHNAWKQVRELPGLWPSQKMAPAPDPRPVAPPPVAPRPTASGSVPRVASPTLSGSVPRVASPTPSGPVPRIASPTPSGPVPRIALPTPSGPVPRVASSTTSGSAPHVASPGRSIPQVQKPAPAAPQVRARSVPVAAERVAEEPGFDWVKWVFFAMGGLLLAAGGINYLFVDQPLVSQMRGTPFAQVKVYAHLGAFVQPGALVIHITPGSPALNPSNFAGFMANLAHGTPARLLGDDFYDRVSLSPGWTGRYSFSGIAWEQLGKMAREDDPQKQKDFILDQLDSASGQPLAGPGTVGAAREEVWSELVGTFASSGP